MGTATAKARKKKATTRKADVLTMGDAWKALGANEEYKPSDANIDRPASAPMLYRLNTEGKLNLV